MFFLVSCSIQNIKGKKKIGKNKYFIFLIRSIKNINLDFFFVFGLISLTASEDIFKVNTCKKNEKKRNDMMKIYLFVILCK